MARTLTWRLDRQRNPDLAVRDSTGAVSLGIQGVAEMTSQQQSGGAHKGWLRGPLSSADSGPIWPIWWLMRGCQCCSICVRAVAGAGRCVGTGTQPAVSRELQEPQWMSHGEEASDLGCGSWAHSWLTGGPKENREWDISPDQFKLQFTQLELPREVRHSTP